MSIGDFADMRTEYDVPGLREGEVLTDPVAQFDAWIAAAHDGGEAEPNAMALATADRSGRPSVRNVLLKGLDEDGRVVWYTNYDSAKGRELSENPQAEVCFVWHGLHRQVRIGGVVIRAEESVSDEYFASRPRGSQLAGAASPQSEVLAGREALEDLVAETASRFEGREVPRPSNCGCYVLTPDRWEFWQGQRSRLHDRFRYRRPVPGEPTAGDGWVIERLAP